MWLPQKFPLSPGSPVRLVEKCAKTSDRIALNTYSNLTQRHFKLDLNLVCNILIVLHVIPYSVSHDSSAGKLTYFTGRPFCGLGSIPDHGGAFWEVFPGLITLYRTVLSQRGRKWLNLPTQAMEIKEEGRNPTMDRQWLKWKKTFTDSWSYSLSESCFVFEFSLSCRLCFWSHSSGSNSILLQHQSSSYSPVELGKSLVCVWGYKKALWSQASSLD